MLRWLERHLGRFAIPNLAMILVAGQTLFLLAGIANPDIIQAMLLIPERVLAGEWWRLLAFMFMPATFSPIFFFFAAYLFWLMGSALEQHWGELRFNLFILIGYLATIASVWIDPSGAATNGYILGSVFLAFAYLYPDFTILLFFILPVKVKWLALITWLFYGFQFVTGDVLTKVVIVAAIANFLLFFGRDIVRTVVTRQRGAVRRARAAADADEPFHKCVVCGKTERSHPQLEFRYCPQCAGAPCYCEEHIHDHTHR